jgi:hypothetical protein
VFISLAIFCLVASILGFFPYNFHPAKIYLGDTGALFLGFMISVLTLQGLKNVTFISLITPLIILGVPVTDTFFAMIRRKTSNMPISMADKQHLHHRHCRIIFFYCIIIKLYEQSGNDCFDYCNGFCFDFPVRVDWVDSGKIWNYYKKFSFLWEQRVPFAGIAQIFQEMSVDVPYESK